MAKCCTTYYYFFFYYNFQLFAGDWSTMISKPLRSYSYSYKKRRFFIYHFQMKTAEKVISDSILAMIENKSLVKFSYQSALLFELNLSEIYIFICFFFFFLLIRDDKISTKWDHLTLHNLIIFMIFYDQVLDIIMLVVIKILHSFIIYKYFTYYGSRLFKSRCFPSAFVLPSTVRCKVMFARGMRVIFAFIISCAWKCFILKCKQNACHKI